MCRAGRDGGRNQAVIEKAKRANRRKVKEQIKKGEEPDSKFSVPYTD